ncbi:hypothetical protein LTR62_001780 [Meristemomyces frigidus]|uniref:NAD(P)-binding protein n=1 Tax=Meristemomyces frigidus TaxID=1508187 RepID=A0AAN7YHW1_9PEZI|nr:hypothetical protein LTR62_001780 [Meristemomyces frigidus]
MQPWALVTPASRGIGLELARRLLQTTNLPVVATARKDLDQATGNILSGLEVKEDRLKMVKLDFLDEDTISSAASQISQAFPKKTSYLHLALCLPGILHPEKSPTQINYDDALMTFRTNTLGPMMLIKHFSPFLPRKSTALGENLDGLPSSAVWTTMSARVGSITDNSLGGWYSYRCSKAAVNQLIKTFDNHLRTAAGEKAMGIALHPGTVKTGLSREFWGNVKEEKLFEPQFAAEKLMEVICSRGLGDRGKCWDWKGEEIPP